jgi:putative FmdB family regulatory protein
VPLYEFRCRSCEERFEAQLPYGELPACPHCGAPDCERVLTPFAGPFTVALRGYAARKSNATRAAREERRREQRAARREREQEQRG